MGGRSTPSSAAAGGSGVDQPYGLNETGFQGLAHDESINGVHQRLRWWNTRLARFNQRDPLGYADGLNHYAGYHVMWGLVDPLGLQTATVPREVFDNEQWPGSESGVPRPGFPRLTENGVIRPVYLDGINEQEHDRIQRHNYLIVLLDIGAIDCDDLLSHRDYLSQYGPQYVAPVGSNRGLTAFEMGITAFGAIGALAKAKTGYQLVKTALKELTEAASGLPIIGKKPRVRGVGGNALDTTKTGLQRNVDPRTIRSGQRQALERSRLNNPDLDMSKPVRVTQDGRLIDGHHRVRHAIDTNTTIDVEVVPGPMNTTIPSKSLDELPVIER